MNDSVTVLKENWKEEEYFTQDFVKFLELSDSFRGWLLTLNDTEFKEIHRLTELCLNEDFAGVDFNQLVLICYNKRVPEDREEFSLRKLSKIYQGVMSDVNIIALRRGGYIELVGDIDDDDDLKMRITEKGKRRKKLLDEK